MHITIDTRENTHIASQILKQYSNIEVDIQQLTHGDFCLNKRIIFERKTLSDFILSIKDKRLFKQTYNTVSLTIPYILILEGVKNSIRESNMNRKAIQGALIHLSVFMGIPILRSKDFQETLELIIAAGNQNEKYNAIDKKRVYLTQQKARRSNIAKLKTQVLQNLPGLGHQLANDMLHEFKSIKQIANSTEKELQQVNGIGKKTAHAIFKVFN